VIFALQSPKSSSAPPTRQTVYIVVTPSPENGTFCSLCFQSLTHSFAGVFSTTPLQSYSSALFAQNTGGGYTLQDLLFIFKDLRTLPDLAFVHPTSSKWAFPGRSSLCASVSLWLSLSAVGVPLEPRCTTTENAPYLHSVHIVTGLFLSPRGGYTPPPLSRAGLPRPARGDSTRRGRSSPFTDHWSQNAGHLSLCLYETSFRVIPSLFSSCRCIDSCIDRCIEGLWQVTVRVRTLTRVNLVYLPCSGRRYKLERSGANHCEGV
jgi:hypothetical protein